MIVYFANRRMNIIGLASTELPKSIRITDDLETSDVDVGVTTLDFLVHFEKGKISELQEITKIGNYVLMEDEEKNSKLYTIITRELDRKERTVDIHCEDAGLDLLNEVVTQWDAPPTAKPISYYIERAVFDSGFQIGINEIPNLTRKLSWDGEATATERLLSIATQFDNAEINYTFTVRNMTVTGKFINIYKKRGSDTSIQLRLGRDIDNITDKETIENLITALRVTGGTQDGSETPITLEGYQYDDGDIYIDGKYLKSRSGVQEWSRYLSDSGTGEGHITANYSYDTLSQSELCNRAVSHLRKFSKVEINYDVDIIDLPKSIDVGDRIDVIDADGKLYLSARILKLEKSRANKTNNATLGDFLIKDSGISQRFQDLADRIAAIRSGDTFYPWVRYADDDQGNGFSSMPLNKDYIAIKYGLNTPTPSDNPADYLGYWTKIVGEIGEQGIPGQPGQDGKTNYTWIRYADTVNGDGISSDPTGKMYLGIAYNRTNSTPSNDPEDYNWSAMYDIEKLEEVTRRINEVNNTTRSETAPNNPNTGDNWFKIDTNGQTIGFFVWNGTDWISSPINQSLLVIEKLISIDLESANITGSKIVNTFTDVIVDGAKLTGTTTIEGANIRIDYIVENGQTGYFIINPKSVYSAIFNSDGTLLNSYELNSSGLTFRDSVAGDGTLRAENLAVPVWKDLIYAPGFTTGDNLPCQYRITKGLGGVTTVELRGGVKRVSGSFENGSTYYPLIIPQEAIPTKNSFALAVDDMLTTAKNRIVALPNGTIQTKTIGSTSNVIYITMTYSIS